MSVKSRRNILKTIAVTAPAAWCKPVVDNVMLPAHASVSCACVPCVFIADVESMAVPAANEWFLPTFYEGPGCEVSPVPGNFYHYVQCPPGDIEDVPDCPACGGGVLQDLSDDLTTTGCSLYAWNTNA